MDAEQLRFTAEHEWVAVTDRGTVLFGVTDYAQQALGDIVYVDLPAVGAELVAGQPCGEVESTKSVSDIYAPVSGTVIARNEALDAAPETINTDPYGAGWVAEVEVADAGVVTDLMDAAAYQALVEAF